MAQQDDKSLWCLYNQTEDILLEGLSFGEGRAVLSVLKPEQKVNWYAWREGWSAWKPVSSCFELIITINRKTVAMSPPAVPKRASQKPATVVVEKEITGSKKTALDLLKRRHRRYQINLEVELICNGRSFLSKTADVSLGGVRLVDVIPDWVAGYSTIYLIHPDSDERIEFMSTLVENQHPPDKRRLEILPSANHRVLKRWLETSGATVLSDEEITKTDPDISKTGS